MVAHALLGENVLLVAALLTVRVHLGRFWIAQVPLLVRGCVGNGSRPNGSTYLPSDVEWLANWDILTVGWIPDG